MDNIKKYNGRIALWIAALLGMGVNYPAIISNTRFGQPLLNVLINTLVIMVLFYFIEMKKIINISTIDYLFGALFSFIYNITFLLIAGEKPDAILGMAYLHGLWNILVTILALFGWTIAFAGLLAFCNYTCKNYKGDKSASFRFLPVFLTILVTWGLVIFFFLPGQVSWDALKQFCEFEGKRVTALNFTYLPTNHNPWFVTLIFGNIFNIGNKILNPNFGIFLIILTQTLISAFIYTRVILFVGQRAGKVAGIVSLIIFCSPIFSSYVMTVDKSTLYYAFCAAFYLSYVKLVEKIKSENVRKRDYLSYLVMMILFSQFRNDSLYISIISTVILLGFLMYKRISISRLLIVLIIFLTVIGGWKAYLNKNKIIPGASSEALTIPVRQLSYVYLNDPNSLSKHDKKVINKITPLNKIRKNYDINSGDNLKNLFPVNTFLNNQSIIRDIVQGKKKLRSNVTIKNELKEYLKVWLTVGIKKPWTYIEVYIAANSYYLNPFSCPPNSSGSLFINFPNRLTSYYYIEPSWIHQYNYLFGPSVRTKAQNLIEAILSFPLIAIFLNTAIAAWLLIFLIYQSIKRKSLYLFLILVPFIFLVCLSTLVPLNGYSRYVIGEIAVILISFACMLNEGVKKNS